MLSSHFGLLLTLILAPNNNDNYVANNKLMNRFFGDGTASSPVAALRALLLPIYPFIHGLLSLGSRFSLPIVQSGLFSPSRLIFLILVGYIPSSWSVLVISMGMNKEVAHPNSSSSPFFWITSLLTSFAFQKRILIIILFFIIHFLKTMNQLFSSI